MRIPHRHRTGADPTPHHALALLLALLAAATLPACAGVSGGRSTLEFDSTSEGTILTPTFTTRVFDSDDPNTADIYLTDIPGLATPEAKGEGMTGNILHIHMFLYPKAGKTPIDFTASNATITHVVLADGAYGVYSGGGFFLPSGKTKGRSFKGRLSNATLRPVSATSGFADLLGWNQLSGSLAAARDEDRADAIRMFLDLILNNPNLAPMQ